MAVEELMGGIVLLSLIVYAVTGGADFGGGVWDLLASGPRAKQQRQAVADAIGPIWEANHVWVILVIVLLFVCFPPGFAALTTALHIPLTLMLVGIVLRGSAFVFRAYDDPEDEPWWSLIFAVASAFTPVMMGLVVGALTSGRIRYDPATERVVADSMWDFVDPWFHPFGFAVGLYALALFSFQAAVYLTIETADDPALQEDFRTRALGAAVAVGVLAFSCLALSFQGAHDVMERLLAQWWSLPFQVLTGLMAVGAIGTLWVRRFAWARVLAIGQVALVMCGWGFAQWPHLLVSGDGGLTFAAASAPENVLWNVLAVLGVGSLILIPSFAYLYRVFKLPAGPAA